MMLIYFILGNKKLRVFFYNILKELSNMNMEIIKKIHLMKKVILVVMIKI